MTLIRTVQEEWFNGSFEIHNTTLSGTDACPVPLKTFKRHTGLFATVLVYFGTVPHPHHEYLHAVLIQYVKRKK